MLSGWGRFPRADCRILMPCDSADVETSIQTESSLIARGNGRAYGDAALNRRATLLMRGLDRLIDFDSTTGLLVCEAGALLADIVALFVPRGWFPPVTPGTKYVTIGGMVAADIHGKNHHIAGSFGRHLVWIDLALADGRILRCSRHEHAELLSATIGGMGLTGVIIRAAFPLSRIESDLIRQTTVKAANLEEVMIHFEERAKATYSVAWTDCLASGHSRGRSLVFIGEHLDRDEATALKRATGNAVKSAPALRVPFDFPSMMLNRFSMTAFNEMYYRTNKQGSRVVNLESYFYPLDAIADWNRMYGSRGFLQYQFVLPKSASFAGISAVLRRITEHEAGCSLAVLKLFGPQQGLMSFPMEGYTLSLDFPVNSRTLSLLPELDAVVAAHDGRLYLAKDARARAGMFVRGYPTLATFAAIRDGVDPTHRFASLQSERLGL